MGYHKKAISKGKLGHYSKIQEELDEYSDAFEQGNYILEQCELADIYGALKHLAAQYHLSMEQLKSMSDATESAFEDGSRK